MKLTRISPKDIKDAMHLKLKHSLHFEAEQIDFERVAQAQLDSCEEEHKEEVKAIKEGIEKYFKHLKDKEPPILITDFLETRLWWQAFWQKLLED